MRSRLPCLLILGTIVLLSGCRQPVEPPTDVAARTPASIQVDGVDWSRVPGDLSGDSRLKRVFRDRKELAESPNVSGTLVAYESASGDRVRFYWIQAWSDSDGWTWVETDRDGKFLASGEGAGPRFPGP